MQLFFLQAAAAAPQMFGERMIIPLDRHFVIYTGGASVDEGDVFYTGSLFYTGTLFCRDTGIEEGPGQWRILHRQPV